MPNPEDLMTLERAAWKALSTGGDAAASFYEDMLAESVLMLLPGGLVVDDRRQVIESMRGDPWSSVELSDERVLVLSDGTTVVAYRGVAVRDSHTYEALFNSTYVAEGGFWRLAVHQQTPI